MTILLEPALRALILFVTITPIVGMILAFVLVKIIPERFLSEQTILPLVIVLVVFLAILGIGIVSGRI